MTKNCPICNQDKPVSDYHKRPSRPDGLHDCCIACCSPAYLAKRHKAIERAKKWKDANPERHKELTALAYQRNGAKKRAYNRQYMRDRWANDPQHRAKRAAYAEAHPQNAWWFWQRKRAKKWGVKEFTATYEEWLDILDAHGHACYYCKATDKILGTEHKIPFARGGQHVKENIVPACQSCNKSKRQLTDIEFLAVRERRIAGEETRKAKIAAQAQSPSAAESPLQVAA